MTAQDFFTKVKIVKEDTVEVEGIGPIKVRGLTASEWDEYESHCLKDGGDGKDKFVPDRAKLVQLGATDPAFAAGDYPSLAKMPVKALSPLANAIAKLSGMGEGDRGNASGSTAAAGSGSS